MSVFRSHIPKRSPITTKVASHGAHRADLKKDFKSRCGYCNSSDAWPFVSWFEIDHFVPRKYLVTITPTDYANLVYACRSCNNAKRAKWPTGDEKRHHHNDEGFIDPCDDTYHLQFSRLPDGKLKALTPLGQWMYNTLHLYKPQHEIIWNIEELDLMIDEIDELLKLNNDEVLDKWRTECLAEFRKYVKALPR